MTSRQLGLFTLTVLLVYMIHATIVGIFNAAVSVAMNFQILAGQVQSEWNWRTIAVSHLVTPVIYAVPILFVWQNRDSLADRLFRSEEPDPEGTSPRSVAIAGLKVVGLLFVSTVAMMIARVVGYFLPFSRPEAPVESKITAVVGLAPAAGLVWLIWMLVVRTPVIADRFLPELSAEEPARTERYVQVALALVGVYLVGTHLPVIIMLAVAWFTTEPDVYGNRTINFLALQADDLIVSAITAAAGAAIFTGRRGLAGLYRKLRPMAATESGQD